MIGGAFKTIKIGAWKIHIAAYNPRNFFTKLLCRYALDKMEAELKNTSREEFEEWCRTKVPDGEKMIEELKKGGYRPNADTKGHPVTPGMEKFEVPIIAWLKSRNHVNP